MREPSKTKQTPANELESLKKRIWELEQLESDRNRVEEALESERTLLRNLIDNVPDRIYAKDSEGRFIICNVAMIHRMGMTSMAELVGKSDFDFLPPEMAQRFRADEQAIIQSGIPMINREEPLSTEGGTITRWNLATKVPLLDKQGNRIGIVGVGREITDRKQAEEALRWSEIQLHAILESTADGILAVDNKGKVIKTNRRFVDLWRIPQSLMDTGDDRALLDFVMKQLSDPDAFLKKVRLLYDSDTMDEDTLAFKDGRVFERFSFPMIMGGVVIGRVWSFRDITERKRIEGELRDSEERYRRIIEASSDAILLRSKENIIYANPTALKLFRANHPEDLIGKQYLDLVHPEDRAISAERIKKTMNENWIAAPREHRMLALDGQVVHVESTGVPVKYRGEAHIFGIFRDITERKLAEHEKAILAGIERLISSTLEIDKVYEQFATEARKMIPFDRLAINLNNRDKGTVTVAYVFGSNVSGLSPGDSFPLQGSVNEALERTRTGMLLHLTNLDEITGQYSRLLSTFQAGIRSFMSVPLISQDKVIGVLHFRSKNPDAYKEHDLRLAEKIGVQIAGAIANAQLYADIKKTEHSLRESEGRFRALIEQAAVGVAEIVMEPWQFITVNRRLCEMVGMTEEELLTTTFQAITHPEDLHLHEEKTALLEAGKIRHYSLEKRYVRKDGETVWVNITVSPLWKPGEKPGRNMVVVEDISERKKMEAEMREMSLRDLLTDLYNRRGFIILAEQQLKASNRAQKPLKLTFIDCDGLKWINDTLGHKEGDKALIDTANVLRQTFRDSDIIARLGGDEFAVLSIDAADMSHEDFSRRLQQHIDNINKRESISYKLSLSWGTAMYHPESPASLDQLISAADELMYDHKKAKRNRRY
jgi:diguanylate cyclase (GGDEF)-like protein/PAS domain S-box-containing protein